ncbi:MAG TPA: HDIG domain-containing protein [Spirochaetota bacterium]|nr:HDIG domain-containing protein [Spirochaetota bacterium]
MLTTVKIISRSVNAAMRNRNIRLSLFLILGIIVISTVLLSINMVGKTHDYSIGDIAREDVRVSGDIVFEIESETRAEKGRVADSVPLVFDRDQSVLVEVLRHIDMLFDHIDITLREIPPTGSEDRTFQLITIKSRLPKFPQYDDHVLFELLRSQNTSDIRQNIKKLMIYILDNGVMPAPYSNPLSIANKNVTMRIINSPQAANEISRGLEEIKTLAEINADIPGLVHAMIQQRTREERTLIISVIKTLVRPNLLFNAEETKRRIEEATKNIKPVTGVLKKGQTIVREGDTITTETLDKISILNSYASTTRINYILGVLLLQVSFLLVFAYFLIEYHSRLLPDRKAPVIIFSIVVLFVFFTFFLSRTDNILNSAMIFTLFLPIAAVTMIIATLFNIFIAIIIGLYLIFFAFMVSNGSLVVIVTAFSSAILGVFVLTGVERRTDFLRGGLILGIINSVVVTGVCLMEDYTLYDTLRNIELSLANGIINSILVLGVFPLFENLFSITTKFNLLELSDLNAPIFRRMLIKAPGTYNHSLMVANMAEAACKDIGANYLLARVGGYYHDIGKIEDAGIYIENKITDKRAKSLKPIEYSRLIISHVEKGIVLSRKNKLPEQVESFIREHHGTTTMTFFYHQALEEADASGENGTVNKTEFQYLGPKPQSRETAVVMLADAVEAASRSLQDPTSVKLESLVKKIIYNKLNDDEFEYSDLTMSDLNKIQRAFMRILNGIFHTRIEYPDNEEVQKLEGKVHIKEDDN